MFDAWFSKDRWLAQLVSNPNRSVVLVGRRTREWSKNPRAVFETPHALVQFWFETPDTLLMWGTGMIWMTGDLPFELKRTLCTARMFVLQPFCKSKRPKKGLSCKWYVCFNMQLWLWNYLPVQRRLRWCGSLPTFPSPHTQQNLPPCTRRRTRSKRTGCKSYSNTYAGILVQ